jgi:fatty acid desaturase
MAHAENIDEVAGAGPEELRSLAVSRLKKRRDFQAHLFAFAVINVLVWGVWAFTGQGYPWPAWLTGAWAIGVIFNGWDVYVRRPITEDEIRREVDRLSRG